MYRNLFASWNSSDTITVFNFCPLFFVACHFFRRQMTDFVRLHFICAPKWHQPEQEQFVSEESPLSRYSFDCLSCVGWFHFFTIIIIAVVCKSEKYFAEPPVDGKQAHAFFPPKCFSFPWSLLEKCYFLQTLRRRCEPRRDREAVSELFCDLIDAGDLL